MSEYPHSEPCDHTSPGGKCNRKPTTYVGEIYYSCEDHEEQMREWVNDA